MSYFKYGSKGINYLMSKDKKLARVMEQVGHIDRVCMDDLFEAVVNAKKVDLGTFELEAVTRITDEEAIAGSAIPEMKDYKERSTNAVYG